MKSAAITVFCSLWMVQASPNAFCQATNNSHMVTVQVLQAIDSTKAAVGTQFAGKFVGAVTTPQGTTLPAGTPAVLALQQTTGGVTLALVSPVAGTEASAGAALGAASNVGSQIGNQLSGLGLGGFGKKKAAPANSSTAAAGRVNIAANAQVRFLVASANTNATAAPTQVSQSQAQPSSLAAPQNVNQPVATTPAAAPVVPASTLPNNGTARAGASPTPTPGQAGSSTVTWGGVQYVLQGCQRQAPHILCQVQMTNLNAGDANLQTNRQSYFVDQSGNRVALNGASVANCNLAGQGGCLALSNLPMIGSFEFIDQDSKSLTLVRLQIQTRTGPVQFTNVAVQ